MRSRGGCIELHRDRTGSMDWTNIGRKFVKKQLWKVKDIQIKDNIAFQTPRAQNPVHTDSFLFPDVKNASQPRYLRSFAHLWSIKHRKYRQFLANNPQKRDILFLQVVFKAAAQTWVFTISAHTPYITISYHLISMNVHTCAQSFLLPMPLVVALQAFRSSLFLR